MMHTDKNFSTQETPCEIVFSVLNDDQFMEKYLFCCFFVCLLQFDFLRKKVHEINQMVNHFFLWFLFSECMLHENKNDQVQYEKYTDQTGCSIRIV